MPPRLDPSLIRAFVDGELDASDAAALEQRLLNDESFARAVACERRMRVSVGSAMRSDVPHAPAALHEQIKQAMRDDSSSVSPTVEVQEKAPIAGRLYGANVWAVAACMVIVAGAVLLGVFGPQIGPSGTKDVGGGNESIADVEQYVTDQHAGCQAASGSLDYFFECSKPQDATSLLSARMKRTFGLFDLAIDNVGYEFVGVSTSSVPDASESCHLVYRKTGLPEGQPSPLISIFVMANEGQLDRSLVPGCCSKWQEAGCAAPPADGEPAAPDSEAVIPGEELPLKWCVGRDRNTEHVFYGTSPDLVFVLVCCDPNDAPLVGQAMALQFNKTCCGGDRR